MILQSRDQRFFRLINFPISYGRLVIGTYFFNKQKSACQGGWPQRDTEQEKFVGLTSGRNFDHSVGTKERFNAEKSLGPCWYCPGVQTLIT